jgi:hypothetical protein
MQGLVLKLDGRNDSNIYTKFKANTGKSYAVSAQSEPSLGEYDRKKN